MTPLICVLVAVIDGDTFDARCRNDTVARFHVEQQKRIRIANIDAPEKRDCVMEHTDSKNALELLLKGDIRVQGLYEDRYGRIVGIVTAKNIPDPNQDDMSMSADVNVGDEMIELGRAKSWRHDDKGKALEPKPEGC